MRRRPRESRSPEMRLEKLVAGTEGKVREKPARKILENFFAHNAGLGSGRKRPNEQET